MLWPWQTSRTRDAGPTVGVIADEIPAPPIADSRDSAEGREYLFTVLPKSAQLVAFSAIQIGADR
jgi:hypothetical protein